MPRKIAVITGTRAEYGLLSWLMKEIQADPELDLQLIVTGAHLSPEFGLTWREIEADGFSIDARVEMLLSGDSTVAITKSLGLGIIGFADALDRLKPHMLVILGDRYEMLGAASTASLAGVPVAHIHGGEITLGAYDDAFRHAITKMSSLHFVAREEYRRRVIQMGESPETVFTVGPACADALFRQPLPTREELESSLGISLEHPLLLVTYHPETRSPVPSDKQIIELLVALGGIPEATVIFTGANADTDGRIINERAAEFCEACPGKRVFVQSLGRKRYWGALAVAGAVVGNSSSGILEAPLLGTPAVNIGRRQEGRIRDPLVLDCPCGRDAIGASVRQALSRGRGVRKSLENMQSPAKLMAENLKSVHIETPKQFYNIPWRE
jgi:UDP-N-acetylglucosamine 2-epimerase (non-hydrolysing)/GDP/UDP-N,N'-diacetylbacillosamine 2-epimerase (hydrolysing)